MNRIGFICLAVILTLDLVNAYDDDDFVWAYDRQLHKFVKLRYGEPTPGPVLRYGNLCPRPTVHW